MKEVITAIGELQVRMEGKLEVNKKKVQVLRQNMWTSEEEMKAGLQEMNAILEACL
jgi:hypothetical protein